MSARSYSLTHLVVFWPLVLLALVVRLTFGGIVSPVVLVEDPLRDLTKLSILCDDQTPLSDPDGQHHHAADPQDDSFLLSEALELFLLSVAFCIFAGLITERVGQTWMFPPIRGPPAPKRTSLCPQGPPV
ncbi:hypothetical protein [Acetobacter ascendens]|uniref:Uncharacterized protein n=1 Tax=Acetobacter ascendens TaxID=481146 RepID=A0A1D8QWX1_9PROT|nr:hypothetical protein [Acetobacter ascendens]AOW46832.1 hypothetical protein A4S02_08665 [Acetobacter ascendens]AOW49138.1 hypothetical protein A4R89_06585 [Acetobacter ascendens]ARW10928.1 hypothetical protein S101447_01866 [Acetobacter ascendens]